MINKAIVWFRNDLRLHDNEALTEALRVADEVIPVFVFDDRVFKNKTSFGFPKTGAYRSQFIIDSVKDLSKSISKIGSSLIVKSGITEDVIFDLAQQTKSSWVFCNRERTQEEVDIQDALETKLWSLGQEIRYCRGKMLYYTSDLPFPISHTPDTFSSFRKEVEKYVSIRKPLDTPSVMPMYTADIVSDPMPSISDFGLTINHTEDISIIKGGESLALQQLKYYLWESDNIANYKETRNEMLGWDFSSKLSAYLAQGCISAKQIYWEVKRYEEERTKNDSTYWLGFELLWRDYFRLVAKKYGNKIFKEYGINANDDFDWSLDRKKFELWANGKTGIPIIDANMRELNATGYMSNRGRQLVASFLVNDMHIHWLLGAEYFESLLIDYDPCSNYGNWNYIAGVGVDPRSDRWFNVVHQAKRYDSKGEYAHRWLTELDMIEGNKIYDLPILDQEEKSTYKINKIYPEPVVVDNRWK